MLNLYICAQECSIILVPNYMKNIGTIKVIYVDIINVMKTKVNPILNSAFKSSMSF